MSKDKEKDTTKKKKKKSPIRKFFTGLFFLLLIVVIILGIFYFLLFDNTKKDLNLRDNYTTEDFTQETIYNALKDTESEKAVKFEVSEQTINDMLNLATKNFSSATGGAVEQIYVDIDDNNYTFVLKVKYMFAETRVILDTTIAPDENNEAIAFTIKDAKVGKLGGFLGLGFTILNRFVDDATINSALASSGLSLKCDLKYHRLTYRYDDIIDDFIKMLNASGSTSDSETIDVQNDFLTPVLEIVKANNLLSLGDSKDTFQVKLDISNMSYNDKYTDKKNARYDVSSKIEDIEKLLNNSVITSDKAQTLANYLVFGYYSITDDEKTYIDSVDLSSIDINDKKAYTPLVNNTPDNLKLKFLSHASSSVLPTPSLNSYLTEDEINTSFYSSNIIGNTTPIVTNFDGKYHVEYMTIDDIYTNILDGKIYINIDININGYVISIALDNSHDNEENIKDYTINLKTEDIYIGSYKANDKLKNSFLKYLKQATYGNDLFQVDPSTDTLSISFKSYITDPTLSSVISSLSTTKAKFTGTSIDDKSAKLSIGLTA